MKVESDITGPRLRQLVSAFYARVRGDDLLGPVFESAVPDWPAHLGLLTDFWSSLMLASGRYHGKPILAHLRHAAAITPAHFDRWLGLWAEVTTERMPAGAASALQAKAERVAKSLQLALFVRPPAVSQTSSEGPPA